MEHHHMGHSSHGQAGEKRVLGIDPVCGMKMFEKPNVPRRDYTGKTYYFCNPGCAAKFEADPERFLKVPGGEPMHPPAPVPAAGGEDVRYTCPMHPEVRRKGPGDCPKCGMALEPVEPTVTEAPNPELGDMARRFWVSVALTVPLLLIAMGGMVPSLQHALSGRWVAWVQLGLATPVVLWGGWPFFVRGWRSIAYRSLTCSR